MGWFSSSEEEASNVVDSNGQVNNNIIIQEAKDTHDQLKLSENLLYATYFICMCELIKLCMYLYSAHNKKMKRKYEQGNRIQP
jgi:hypothetical protein